MNETIGVKGGYQDFRRSLIITKKNKEKLEAYQAEKNKKELLELEKRVKLQQKITLIKVLPMVVIGQIYEKLTENNEEHKKLVLEAAIKQLEQENMFSEKDLEEIISALKSNTVHLLDDGLLGKLGVIPEGYKRVSEIDITDFMDKSIKEKQPPESENKVSKNTTEAILKVIEISKNQEATNETIVSARREKIQPGITAMDSIDERLDKLKNHKIVDAYEHKLKEVRKELRELIFEYNLIADASDNIYRSKEATELIDRLNEIIKKLEELKNAIVVPDVDKYDDNYLYTLIQEYLAEFDNKNFVDEIKDSSLYIMISSKLAELDTKKDRLQEKLESKKEKLELNEEHLEELKERYFNFERFNNDLLNFQASQDRILDEIREKMSKATTITERVEAQIVGMTRQNRRLLGMLAASMALPGARSARGIATLIATNLYFMRNIMRPNTVTRRYKVVNTIDYQKDIESSISQLDDVSGLLKKTSKQIDNTIEEVEKNFAQYINVIPECKELLANLERIKDQIKEKEYELQRIKEEQQVNLSKNDAKVKTLNYEEQM